jgi:hypothetical protein
MSSRYLLSVFGRLLAKVTLHAPESALSPHKYILYSLHADVVMDKRTSHIPTCAGEQEKHGFRISPEKSQVVWSAAALSIIFLFDRSATRCAVS